ncbi:MAG: SCO family protein [Candidatus Promineifilaceae bacterium]
MSNLLNTDGLDQPQIKKKRNFFPVLILGGFLIGLALGWLAIQLSSDSGFFDGEEYYGNVIEYPDLAAEFTLTSHTGEPVSLSDFDEKVVLLYFGYTYCPDVCPASMAQLAKATNELTAEEKEQVQVAMITVDPHRDSKEIMADYMGHFDPTFLGLTGTEGEIATVADAYGVYYEKQAGSPEIDYLVNHTASVFVIDKDGYLRMLYPFSTPGENIASDLRQLVRE